MTTRMYYTDATLTEFTSTIVSCDTREARTTVVLEATAFYPTSGGQPHDLGTLGDASVLDVIDAEDGRILHVLDRPLAVGATVTGLIDPVRRFDHMQQHSGQHVLSAAFEQTCGVRTESFHLGTTGCTIDLAREVTPTEIVAAEDAANRVVWSDRPVSVRFASEQEAAALPLRKESHRSGTLRLVEIADCDLSACGGTHVSRTGMIGVIAVTGWERFKGGSRINFVCGGRALASHRRLRDQMAAVTRHLSVGGADAADAVERLQHDVRTHQRSARLLQEEVAALQAAALAAAAEDVGRFRRVIVQREGWDATAIKALASALVAQPGLVAVVTGSGTPAPCVIARSSDVAFDAGAAIKEITSTLGGRGGGRPELAQGAIPDATAFLELVRDSIR